MAKAILVSRLGSHYDDVREDRYHFPQQYLNRAKQAVGDEIIYYEPRRNGGRSAYVAIARIAEIAADPKRTGYFYAHITNFIDFDRPVPFREPNGTFYESFLRNLDGSVNLGALQSGAVRLIPEHEFDTIIQAAFAMDETQMKPVSETGFADPQPPFARPIREYLVNRPFREAAFARHVRQAYNSTCALTGIRLINGGGRAEMESAHIVPVAEGHNGTDSVRNGIALCQTVHWMFDRGLISLAEDHKILFAKEHLPTNMTRLFNTDLQAVVPREAASRPHPEFLRYHRTVIFKG